MKALLAAGMVSLSLCGGANAVNLDRVSSCMEMADSDRDSGAMAEMRVELSEAGDVLKVDVLRYQPDTEQGRRLARLSADAVVNCSPYAGESGTSTILFWPDGMPAGNPIVTMPDNADGTDNSLANEIQQIIGGQ